jgi:plastocyanin
MRRARVRTWSILLTLAVGAGWSALSAVPAAAGGGCHVPLTDRTGAAVNAADLCFTPTVIRVPAGATVTWTNDDSFDHTVTGVGGAWGSYDVLRPHRTVAHAFDTPGVFPYYCAIHPGMVGAVVVGNGLPGATAASAGAAAPPPTAEPSPAAAAAPAGGSTAPSNAWRSVALVALVALALLAAVAVLAVRRRPGTGEPQPRHTAG